MESTTRPVDPVTQNPGNDNPGNTRNIWIVSTVVPFLVVVVILLAVIKRKVRRTNKMMKNIVYIIPEKEYQAKNVLDQSNSLPTSMVSTPSEGSSKKQQGKDKKIRIIIPRNRNKKIQSASSFPREPLYKSQETPSYIVPFSALPNNFDFSLQNVEVYSDFVIIKDLDILQTYWYEKEEKREEYQKQPVYNPNFI